MAFDDFRHYVTFHSICDTIQNKRELDLHSKVYFRWAKEFFDQVSKSLDSMLDTKEYGGYYFMEPSIKEAFANYGENISNMSGPRIIEIKNEFETISKNLERLSVDADSFYKTPEAEKTFNFLSKLLPPESGFSQYSKRDDLEGND